MKYLISFPGAAMVATGDELDAAGRDSHAVIEQAKARPNALRYSSAGLGSSQAGRRPPSSSPRACSPRRTH